MAEILNKDYKKVKEYDFTCPHCGAMARFKKYELNFYEDCYDTPCVEFRCPNCNKFVTFPEKEIDKKDLYEINQKFAEHISDVVIKSTEEFHKKASILSLIVIAGIIGIFWLIVWLCNG